MCNDPSRLSVMCASRNLVLLTTSTALLLRGEWPGCFLLKSINSLFFSTFRGRLFTLHQCTIIKHVSSACLMMLGDDHVKMRNFSQPAAFARWCSCPPGVPGSDGEQRRWHHLWSGSTGKQTDVDRVQGTSVEMVWSFTSLSKHFIMMDVTGWLSLRQEMVDLLGTGGRFKTGWNNSLLQRGVKDVCKHLCQLVSTFPEHSSWNVVRACL